MSPRTTGIVASSAFVAQLGRPSPATARCRRPAPRVRASGTATRPVPIASSSAAPARGELREPVHRRAEHLRREHAGARRVVAGGGLGVPDVVALHAGTMCDARAACPAAGRSPEAGSAGEAGGRRPPAGAARRRRARGGAAPAPRCGVARVSPSQGKRRKICAEAPTKRLLHQAPSPVWGCESGRRQGQRACARGFAALDPGPLCEREGGTRRGRVRRGCLRGGSGSRYGAAPARVWRNW